MIYSEEPIFEAIGDYLFNAHEFSVDFPLREEWASDEGISLSCIDIKWKLCFTVGFFDSMAGACIFSENFEISQSHNLAVYATIFKQK